MHQKKRMVNNAANSRVSTTLAAKLNLIQCYQNWHTSRVIQYRKQSLQRFCDTEG